MSRAIRRRSSDLPPKRRRSARSALSRRLSPQGRSASSRDRRPRRTCRNGARPLRRPLLQQWQRPRLHPNRPSRLSSSTRRPRKIGSSTSGSSSTTRASCLAPFAVTRVLVAAVFGVVIALTGTGLAGDAEDLSRADQAAGPAERGHDGAEQSRARGALGCRLADARGGGDRAAARQPDLDDRHHQPDGGMAANARADPADQGRADRDRVCAAGRRPTRSSIRWSATSNRR